MPAERYYHEAAATEARREYRRRAVLARKLRWDLEWADHHLANAESDLERAVFWDDLYYVGDDDPYAQPWGVDHHRVRGGQWSWADVYVEVAAKVARLEVEYERAEIAAEEAWIDATDAADDRDWEAAWAA